MNHAVVLAHPNRDSFNAAVASAYVECLKGLGQAVVLRDLYAMKFDPCLKTGEIPGPGAYAPEPDVLAERALLAKVDVFTFIYPFWFNAPPAILKGYVDRIFSMGFGYEPDFGGTRPGLTGRRLMSFSSSGAPDTWVRSTGALANLQTVFDHHLAAVCGMTVLDHIHFGAIVSNIVPEAVEASLDQVRATTREHFAVRT